MSCNTTIVSLSFFHGSDNEVNEVPYDRACEGSRELWCKFTQHQLPFLGSFLIRVRAEAGQLHSNWTQPIEFRPEQHGECQCSPLQEFIFKIVVTFSHFLVFVFYFVLVKL